MRLLILLLALLVFATSPAFACRTLVCTTLTDYQGNPQTICSCLDSR